jgi:cbb3-type cytochrome oxidase subunit 3
MDVNLLRSVLAVIVFAAFLAIAWWAYLPSRKAVLDRVALSVLGEDS